VEEDKKNENYLCIDYIVGYFERHRKKGCDETISSKGPRGSNCYMLVKGRIRGKKIKRGKRYKRMRKTPN